MLEHEVGLFNTSIRIGDNMYPANVFTIENINELIDKAFYSLNQLKREGDYNDHKTVKPLTICEYLIKLSAFQERQLS